MSDPVVEILKSVGAVITDSHFVYTSGKHGSVYINKDALYPHISQTSQVCLMMAQKFKDKEIDVVAGPALGGIILSQWVAFHLGKMKGKPILSVYAEKDETGNQVFRRGYDKLLKGKKVLVVEDLTTTGGSVRKVVDQVKANGGQVVAVCVMVNRDPEHVTDEQVGAPLVSAGVLKAEAFGEKDCPLCKAKVPINTDVGHGREYLNKKK